MPRWKNLITMCEPAGHFGVVECGLGMASETEVVQCGIAD